MSKAIEQLKQINATIVKELSGQMKKAELRDGEDMLGIASVQMEDSDGDVITIDGITFDKYHNPPQRHLKLLAQHMASNMEAEPTVVGRIERFFKTTVVENGEEVPALAFAFSFAKDEEGQLTPLAATYRKLMPRYIDSFSVGVMVKEWDERKESGGMDIKSSELFEISVVSVPSNPGANVLQTIAKTFKKQNLALPKDLNDTLKEDKEGSKEEPKEEKEGSKEEDKEINNTIKDYNEDIKKYIDSKFESIIERLDSIEASLVIASEEGEQTDDTKGHSDADLKELYDALDKLKNINTK